jgi:hypothetical protein
MIIPDSARELIESGAKLENVRANPRVTCPPMDDPPPGVRLRIAVDRVSGIGPWSD